MAINKIARIAFFTLTILIFTISTTVILTLFFLNSPRAIKATISALAPVTNFYADFHSISFSLPFNLRVEDLVIYDNASLKNNSINIKNLALKAGLDFYSNGAIHLEKIELLDATIDFIIKADGKFKMEFLNGPEKPKVANKEPSQPLNIIIDQINIENSNLLFLLEQSPLGVELKNLNLSSQNFDFSKLSKLNIKSYVNYFQGQKNPTTGNPAFYVRGDLDGYINFLFSGDLGQIRTDIDSNVPIFQASFFKNDLTNAHLKLNFVSDLKNSIYRWDYGRLTWGSNNDLQVMGRVDVNNRQKLVDTTAYYKSDNVTEITHIFGIDLKYKLKPNLHALVVYNSADSGVYIDWLSLKLNQAKYFFRGFINQLGGPKPLGFSANLMASDSNPNQQLNSLHIDNVNINNPLKINVNSSGNLQNFRADINKITIGSSTIALKSQNSAVNNNFTSNFDLMINSPNLNEWLSYFNLAPLPNTEKLDLHINSAINTASKSLIVNRMSINNSYEPISINGSYKNWQKTNDISFNIAGSSKSNIKIIGDSSSTKASGEWHNKNIDLVLNSQINNINQNLSYSGSSDLTFKKITELLNYWSVNPTSFIIPESAAIKLNFNGDKETIALNNSTINFADAAITIDELKAALGKNKKADLKFTVSNLHLEKFINDSNSNEPTEASDTKEVATKKTALKPLAEREILKQKYLDLINQYSLDINGQILNSSFYDLKLDNFKLAAKLDPYKNQSLDLDGLVNSDSVKLNQTFSLDGNNSLKGNLVFDSADKNSQLLLDFSASGKKYINYLDSLNIYFQGDIKNYQQGPATINSNFIFKIAKEKLNLNLARFNFDDSETKLNINKLLLNSNLSGVLNDKYNIGSFELDSLAYQAPKSQSKVFDIKAILSLLDQIAAVKSNEKLKIIPKINLSQLPKIELGPIVLNEYIKLTTLDAEKSVKSELFINPFKINHYSQKGKLPIDLDLTSTEYDLTSDSIKYKSEIELKSSLNINTDNNKISYLADKILIKLPNNNEIKGDLALNWLTLLQKIDSKINMDFASSKAEFSASLAQLNSGLSTVLALNIDIPDYNPIFQLYDEKGRLDKFPIKLALSGQATNYNINIDSKNSSIAGAPLDIALTSSNKAGLQANFTLAFSNFYQQIDKFTKAHGYSMPNLERIKSVKLNSSLSNRPVLSWQVTFLAGLSDLKSRLNYSNSAKKLEIDLASNEINLDDWQLINNNPKPAVTPEPKVAESSADLKDNINNLYKNINSSPLWSNKELPNINQNSKLTISKVVWHNEQLKDINLQTSFTNGSAYIDNFSFKQPNEGKVNLKANLNFSQLSSPHKLNINATELNLAQLQEFLGLAPSAFGKANIEIYSNSLGNSSKSLIENLRGNFSLKSNQVHTVYNEIDKYSCLATSATRASYFTQDVTGGSDIANVNISGDILDGVVNLNPKLNAETTSLAIRGSRGYFDLNNANINLSLNSKLFSSNKYGACRTQILANAQDLNLKCQGNLKDQNLTSICSPNFSDLALVVGNIVTSILNPLEWARRVYGYFVD